ncbi:glycosyltransferase family 39 protein [Mycolicibacterium confluentis]|uniref:glycosyltransferase family 39 protein n=1 Tax=Mycolicibacterium confluentis TaxID=28047 RepID=UPI000A15DBD1|nr:glycosyltransferase family 39 protein [Mycolicibacterium confluentis]
MTITAPRSTATSAPTPVRGSRREAVAVVALLAATAWAYLWDLGASGWANGFYAAAVQAGSQSWTAWVFGSSDAANAITVDKTPGALWVMGISVRLFGFNAWSMLVPQALMGVAAVAMLYAAVRRAAGPRAAMLAGTVLALTPVAALIFRFNNPDALLVLMLVVATHCVQRAVERDSSRWWMVLAGTAIGVGFLAKMLQAVLVLPVLAVVFLVCADMPWRSRLLRLCGGAAGLVASAGWYLLLVEVWPSHARPYIGGSQNNSIVELALGYNGVGRLTGEEVGGLGNLNHDVGWGRLLGGEMGGPIGWLLPAAVIALVAGLAIVWRRPRTDPTRIGLLLWGGWLLTTAVVFSWMNGIVHPYYTVALAPAVAACIGIGVPLVWDRRTDPRCATTLAGLTATTTLVSFILLQRHPSWLPWLQWTVLMVGLTTALLLVVVARLTPRSAVAVGAAALVACLVGPFAYTVATAATPHTGAVPSAGPSGGFGGPPGFLDISRPSAQLAATIAADAGDYTWAAAVVGSNNAAGHQLATGAPVMAVGGFNGTDPAPTLEQFQDYARSGRIHYFIAASMPGPGRTDHGGSDAAERITEWVEATFPFQVIDGTTLYDLGA